MTGNLAEQESIRFAADVLRCIQDALTGGGRLTQTSVCLRYGKQYRTLARDAAAKLEKLVLVEPV